MATKKRWEIMEIKNKYLYYLGLLIIAGAILRLYNLGYNSLWLDEATTYTISSQSFLGIWQSMINGEFNPPLFYWIEHIILWFGNSEILLRIVPAIFGILTIPVFYFIGKEFLNDKIGIVMATIATFSPFLILYSQEARAYSTMLFFISLVFLLYLKNNQWILFGIMSSIAIWIHFYSFVAISVLILIHLVVYKQKEIIKGIITIIVLCAPLFYEGSKLFLLRTSTPPSFGLQGWDLIINSLNQICGFNIIAATIFILFLIIGLLFINDKNKSTMLCATIIGIMIISFILSYKIPMLPKYLIVLIPFFYLAISLMFSKIKTKTVICALLAILILAGTPFLYSYYTQYTKDDWRGFANTLELNTNYGDNVIIVPGYISQPLNYYYDNSTDKTTEIFINNVSDLKGVKGWVVLTEDATSEETRWIENKTNLGIKYGNIYLYNI